LPFSKSCNPTISSLNSVPHHHHHHCCCCCSGYWIFLAKTPSLSQQHSFPLHLVGPYTLERADDRVVDQSLDNETGTRQYIDPGIRVVTGSLRRGD
jgi:hypothetical protein